MENAITFYQQCIKTLLQRYEALKTNYSHAEVIFDDERYRYLVVWVGWMKSKRIYQTAIHIEICHQEIVIQCNDTEDLLVTELIELGIPQEKIRLGFVSPEAQAYRAHELDRSLHLPCDNIAERQQQIAV